MVSEDPTWRYTFGDGRRFTSHLPFDMAESQALAVEKIDGSPIVKLEQYVPLFGGWEAVPLRPSTDAAEGKTE